MTSKSRMRWTFWLAIQQLPAVIAAAFFIVVLGFVAMLSLGSVPVMAQEVISQEEPTPSSVDEVTTPMERTFKEKPPLPRPFPWLKEQLKDTPAFFRDTKLTLNFRTYYFNRDKYDDSNSEA